MKKAHFVIVLVLIFFYSKGGSISFDYQTQQSLTPTPNSQPTTVPKSPIQVNSDRIRKTINDKCLDARSDITKGNIEEGEIKFNEALKSIEDEDKKLDENYDNILQVARLGCLNNTGDGYIAIHEYYKALDRYDLIVNDSKFNLTVPDKIHNKEQLSFIYINIGQYQDALRIYQELVHDYEENNTSSSSNDLKKGLSYAQMASIYQIIGDDQKFFEKIHEANETLNLVNDGELGGQAYQNMSRIDILIGNYYFKKEDYINANKYYNQSYENLKKIDNKDGVIIALIKMGGSQLALKNQVEALRIIGESQKVINDIDDSYAKASVFNAIGAIYISIDRIDDAKKTYAQALDLENQHNDVTGEIITQTNLGIIYEKENNIDRAIDSYNRAINLIEKIQANLKLEELLSSYTSDRVQPYNRLLNIYVSQGKIDLAFNIAERARAKAFLNQLANGHVKTSDSGNGALIQKEQVSRNELIRVENKLLDATTQPKSKQDPSLIQALQTEYQEKQKNYDDVLREMRLNNSSYKNLILQDPVTIKSFKTYIPDNTAIISYYILKDKLIIFVITKNDQKVVTVPIDKHSLETKIEQVRSSSSLTDDFSQLYDWLITPIKDKIDPSIRNLGIIPHGQLHYLPFAALHNSSNNTDIIDEYTLFTMPSASAFTYIQKRTNITSKNPKVLVIAEGNISSKVSLPQVNIEAQSIKGVINSTIVYSNSQATKSILISESPNATILHIAAHAELNPYNPLFSAIDLAPENTGVATDGLLSVQDIYGLTLNNLDLVVLSACNTTLGKKSEGDDIISLNRAFLYAGSQSVISSLWSVEDHPANVLLMKSFYSHLAQGENKASALRKAQQETRAKYPNPYYWASFTLSGNPGILQQDNKYSNLWIVLLVLIFLFIILLFMIKFDKYRKWKGKVFL